VLVDANMPAHGHGMTVVPVAEGGEGQWTVAPMLFHMTGHWQITVDIDGPAGWEQAVFDVRCCD
jgi:hypothetical protein